jgi:hypothetical protein
VSLVSRTMTRVFGRRLAAIRSDPRLATGLRLHANDRGDRHWFEARDLKRALGSHRAIELLGGAYDESNKRLAPC